MAKESKSCRFVIKKSFNKELVMTKADHENFERSTKCDNSVFEGDVQVTDQCHVSGKYRGAAHRDCKVNVSLNNKILTVFCNLKHYDAHVVIEELGKFDFKIIVIPNGVEKYMSISLDIKLVFVDSFQYLSSSLDSLVKNLGEIDFKLLSQEFDCEVLDLVKQKGFYFCEYMSSLESLMTHCVAKASVIDH